MAMSNRSQPHEAALSQLRDGLAYAVTMIVNLRAKLLRHEPEAETATIAAALATNYLEYLVKMRCAHLPAPLGCICDCQSHLDPSKPDRQSRNICASRYISAALRISA
jgi:hypothetical protein